MSRTEKIAAMRWARLEATLRKNKRLVRSYGYQRRLTPKLDSIGRERFSLQTIDEIVLWKVDRFVEVSRSLLSAINRLRDISFSELEEARPALARLLCTPGVQLAMASTFLRFRNPHVFQIIDERAFRMVRGKRATYPHKIREGSPRYVSRSIEIYFEYLKELRMLSRRTRVRYELMDRLLYMLDKRQNRLTRSSRRR